MLKLNTLMRSLLVASLITAVLTSCEKPAEPTRIALNPWPGYEFLYLAEQKGFFEAVELNVRILQLGSLADAQRTVLAGHADGLASTLIEAVQISAIGNKPLKVVMITDYSNGGDVIIAAEGINSIADLKGKTVGCEVSSLGIYFLQRALAQAGLTIDDVNIHNIEQNQGQLALEHGEIDAFVTYPPVSISLLKTLTNRVIFSSADIPEEIIDVVSVNEDVLIKDPQFVTKLHKAWTMALDYYESNSRDAIKIMAEREGINPLDFKAALNDLTILNAKDQERLFNNPQRLQTSVLEVCSTLTTVGSITADCTNFPDIIYQEPTDHKQ